MADDELKIYEKAINRIFPGLQMYVRDTFLDDKIVEKYEIGKIIREPTFCDVSCRVGGLITSHRYAILSNHFVDFSSFEQDTNWGLYVCKRGSYFKVLDVYKIEDKTQIALLHLDNDWKLFENNFSNVEEDIIKMSRERFDKKYKMPPIPELATKQWIERVFYPIGVNFDGDYVPLDTALIKEGESETAKAILQLDNVLEKAYKSMNIENYG